jgi:hypothetical protein
MKVGSVVQAGSLLALGILMMTGCETGRGTKLHARFLHLSDTTTVPSRSSEPVQVAVSNPLVPGSPTASGEDGRQPLNDSDARKAAGAEEGKAALPRTNLSNGFIRQ